MSKTDPYAVTQVKRTTGYAENQGSWPQVNRQHAYNIYLQQSGHIKCIISKLG